MDWSVLHLDLDAATPLYLQLCNNLGDHITYGDLQPGDQLPSERKLAELLSVSRTTAINAYRELEARGLVRSYVGRGTFVSGRAERIGAPFAWRGKASPAVQQHLNMNLRALVTLTRPDEISFGAGAPALEYFPVQAYTAATEQILATRPREAFGFLPTEGHPYLREVIAARENVRPEEVLVVSGTQQALDLIARCLIYPQDTAVMDWPGFLGAIQTFRFSGALLAGWDIVKADLEELEDLFVKRRPKLLYLNPSFQNPTGRTLSLDLRHAVIDLARRYRVPVVEDEAYRDLYFAKPPPPTLFELEGNGLVIHLRTFAKTFAPSLRLGYVLADENIIDQLALVKAQSDLFSPGLSQLVVATLLADGTFDIYTRLLRCKHQERAAAMDRALETCLPKGELLWDMPQGGLYLWARLASQYSHDLLQEATKQSVNFARGDSFYFGGTGKRTLRLCYSATPPEGIIEGVKRLASALGCLDAS